jgi:RHS repeat-associated protein
MRRRSLVFRLLSLTGISALSVGLLQPTLSAGAAATFRVASVQMAPPVNVSKAPAGQSLALAQSSQSVAPAALTTLSPGIWSLTFTTTDKSGVSWASLPSGGGIEVAAPVGSSLSRLVVSIPTGAQAAKAHLHGLGFTITRSDQLPGSASAEISLPDTLVDGAFGADYAARIGWVQYPITASGAPSGPATPVRTSHSNGSTLLQPTASSQTMMIAAASSPASSTGTGTFAATPIRPTSTWKVSPQTGDFSWSYPMRVPPPAAGPVPSLALTYDSQSIDGETGSTNNQPSTVGDGWSLTGGGSIARSFVPCFADDGSTGPVASSGDLCWSTDNATINLNGRSEAIVHGSDGGWRLLDDGGSRIQYLTGTANGTYDGGYWVVTTTDGTKYYFGLNQLPGYASGDRQTNSAWSVPVYGNDPGEPCHGATFAASVCTQAWQWNLDYVVDTHSNADALYYTTYTNDYQQDNVAAISYTRSGDLAEIDYGLSASTIYGSNASSAKALFSYAARCETGLSGEPSGACNPASPTASYWPDTPWDQSCTSSPCTQTSPTFWSTTMLSSVTTQILSSGAYTNVDAWALSHSWPNPGDGTSPALWMTQVAHTGYEGSSSITEPPTTFNGAPYYNRVWVVNGLAPLAKYRIVAIDTTTGSIITVAYSGPTLQNGQADPQACTPTLVQTLAPETNTYRCFPQWWTPPTTPTPPASLDWFNLYVVTAIDVSPNTGGPNDATQETDYIYTGRPAWRFDSAPGTLDNQRTWSVYAGYNTVEVRQGNPNQPSLQTTTDYTFYRGLNGDPNGTITNPTSSTRQVSLTASNGTLVPDSAAWQGQAFETITRLGSSGGTSQSTTPVLSDTVRTLWASPPTESTSRTYSYTDPSNGTVYRGTLNLGSFQTGESVATTTKPLSTGGSSTVTTSTTYDGYGRPSQVEVDTSNAGSTCATTGYATNTSAWLMSYPVETTVLDLPCSATPTYPNDVISQSATLYDGASTIAGQSPTKGDATTTEQVSGYGSNNASAEIWQTTATNVYDTLGRVTSTTDPRTSPTRTTTTAYTPTTGGPLTSETVTNPLSQATTTAYNPEWGQPTSVTDPDGNVTTATYDALGRTSQVWLPVHPYATNPSSPSTAYSYSESTTAPNVLTATVLNASGSTTTSYSLYDGLGQIRQTQSPAESGGIDLVDTYHDASGRVDDTTATYYATGTPSGTLLVPNTSLPSQTETTYDGAGRTLATILLTNGQPFSGTEVWRTSQSYQGTDRVDMTPPFGGTPTTTYTNTLGETTKLTQWLSATPGSGTAETTTYGHDGRGDVTAMSDPAGNQWSWTYNVLDEQTSQSDPDTGTTTFSYTPAGDRATSTDANGTTLTTTYDLLDRPTAEYQGTTAGIELSAWTYDTATLGKGNLASETGYVGGIAGQPGTGTPYKQSVAAYNAGGSPTSETMTIPSGNPGGALLAATYTNTYTYKADGSGATKVDPAEGGLPAETLSYGYDSFGSPTGLRSAVASYVAGTTYTNLGQLGQITQLQGAEVWRTFSYDPGTLRISQLLTQRYASTNAIVSDPYYIYNNAGDITEISDQTPATGTDTQCYSYDFQQNLTQAWTPASGSCSNQPTATTLGGPAPYWTNYSIDPATGNRTAVTQNPTSGTGLATASTYAYPASGTTHPNAVQTITATTGSTNTVSNYAYNANGSTTAAPGQTLTYTPQGELSTTTISSTGATQTNIYLPDGTLLEQSDPTNGTTLFLGDTQLHVAPGGTSATGTRTYSYNGQALAERDTTVGVTGSHLYFLNVSLQNTGVAVVDTTTANVTARRYYDPFGNIRGATGAWTSANGYLNAPNDSFTGTTTLGPRNYNPATGRFLQVDPELHPTNPQQSNGYTYALNNPVSQTDPTGFDPWQIDSDPTCTGTPGQCESSPANLYAVDVLNSPKPAPSPYPSAQTIDNLYGTYTGASSTPTDQVKSDVTNLYMGAAVLPPAAQPWYLYAKLTPHPAIQFLLPEITAAANILPTAVAQIACATQPESCPLDEAGTAALWSADAGAENGAFPAIKAGSAGGETAGQAFPQGTRQAALDENPGTCVYCHMETNSPQVDHAIPRAQGGNATIDNAQTTCSWCNKSKGGRDFPVNPPPGYRGSWPPGWWAVPGDGP